MEGTPPVQIIPTRAQSPQEALYAGLDPIAGAVQQYGQRRFETGMEAYKAAITQRTQEMIDRRWYDRASMQEAGREKSAYAMEAGRENAAKISRVGDDIRSLQAVIPAKNYPTGLTGDPVKDYPKWAQAAQQFGQDKIDTEQKNKLDQFNGNVSTLISGKQKFDGIQHQISDLLTNPNASTIATNQLLYDGNTQRSFIDSLPDTMQKGFQKLIGRGMTPIQAATYYDQSTGGKGGSAVASVQNYINNTLVPQLNDPTKLSQAKQFQLAMLAQASKQISESMDKIQMNDPAASTEFNRQILSAATQPTQTQTQTGGLPPALPPRGATTASPVTPMVSINPIGRSPQTQAFVDLVNRQQQQQQNNGNPFFQFQVPPSNGINTQMGASYFRPQPTPMVPLNIQPVASLASFGMMPQPQVQGYSPIPVMGSNQTPPQLDASQLAASLGLYNAGQAPTTGQPSYAAALGINNGSWNAMQ